ncbi:MAG: flavin reductase family protein [Gemmataceae bacterium]
MDVTAASTLFAWIDREIWLVTAQDGSRRGGMIATQVMQASFVADMPRMVLGVARHHYTWELISASRTCALHLLTEENLDLVWRFGLESGRDGDKLDGIEVTTGITGCPRMNHTVGWLDCRVETELELGDRTLFVLDVVEGCVNNFTRPLNMRRLMELAPSPLLTQLQRNRHQQGFIEAEAVRLWREELAEKRAEPDSPK